MIHPTAIVHPKALIGADCHIGPYCLIGEHVVLAERCRLHSHVVLEGHTTLGCDNEIYPFTSLGMKSQDLKWKGGVTRVHIGDRNVFRESVSVHSATSNGDVTRVGSDNYFLANTHLAHDVQVGNRVIMSNLATLAGHVIVEDHAIIGGLAAVHQFCRIGRYAMVGGCSKVVQDVAPYMMADGNPTETRFVNKVGLERAGFAADTIDTLIKAYKIIFRMGLTLDNALSRVEADLPTSPELKELIQFVRSSQRGLAR